MYTLTTSLEKQNKTNHEVEKDGDIHNDTSQGGRNEAPFFATFNGKN